MSAGPSGDPGADLGADLGAERLAVRDAFRRFAAQEVRPRAREIDEEGVFPRDLFRAAGELGFFGMRYPEEAGGSGCDRLTYCLAVEELAWGSLSLAAACAMQSLMGTRFLHRAGDPALVDAYLRPALRGERIGAICMTEPGAGSDLGAMTTRAERDGEEWRLTGEKTWVTSAEVADFFSVFARVGEDGLGCFLLDRDAPGLEIGRPIPKLGVRGSPASEVHLEGARARAVLVPGDRGRKELMGTLTEIRLMTAALSLGVGRAAVEDAVAYARQRIAFGRPIAQHQAVQEHLAEAATEIEAARQLTWHAARTADAGRGTPGLAAMAKLFATEAATRAADRAFRVLASYGYAMEYPVQRYLRDVRFTLVGGGTSEVLRSVIAREVCQ
ncbi:acyl-CoA dehydrogenase family protein [Myxococcota bacterium]|nr:acyl-CoA dehydrogenase family protein [Myxococcota bacterium]